MGAGEKTFGGGVLFGFVGCIWFCGVLNTSGGGGAKSWGGGNPCMNVFVA